MKNIDFKKLLPHGLAILAFLAISAAYFFPELEGKKLHQSDIVHFKGMSKEISDYREATGEEALWTNSMFGGMPAYQISVKYPNPVLKPFDIVLRAFTKGGLGMVFLYMLSFYLMCIVLGIDPWIGVLGAIAFGLSSYHLIILEAGHNSKAIAIGYLPGVVAGFLLLFHKRKYLLGTLVTAFYLGLQLMSNHPQITYYMLLVLIIVGIAYAIDAIIKKELGHLAKAIGFFALGSLLAIGTSASRLLTTLEYSKSTIRGPSELTSSAENRTSGLEKDYALAWSYGISESWSLLVPNANGGGTGLIGSDSDALNKVSRANRQTISRSVNRYWGDQTFTSGPVYIGAIVILLALLGMWYVNGPLKYGLIIAALLTLMLSWGKNFLPLSDWFLENFPMYNKFRAVSMTLVACEFIFPLLAVLGLHQVVKNKEEVAKNIKPFFAISGALTVLLIFMMISPTTFTSFLSNVSPAAGLNELEFYDSQLKGANYSAAQIDTFMEDVVAVRKSLFTSDVLRSLLFVLAGGLLMWLFISSKIKMAYLMVGLSLLTLADLWSVDKRYLSEENFVKKKQAANPIQESGVDKAIAQDTDLHYRVWNTTSRLDQDSRTSFFHKSLGGYHGAKLRRYQEVITQHLSNNNRSVMDMLNTKYVIAQGQDGALKPQLNSNALGNAWFVEDLKMVDNADQEIAALSDFDPKTQAVIDTRFQVDEGSLFKSEDPHATIKLTSYDPKLMEYESSSSIGQFAVFSEIYYQPGWNAYIDQSPVEHVRVNYILRGLKIPAGNHTIDFRFEPSSYSTGNMIVYVCSILMLILLIGGVYLSIKEHDIADPLIESAKH